MVVGKGLLAGAFHRYHDNERKIIFASGVSNSQQAEQAEFEREKKLLASFRNRNAQLIYFSTVSVYDFSIRDSAYIRHKKAMEQLIKKEFSSYLIFRLPILVGRSDNPHTLTNFLHYQIISRQPIFVFKNACRYLMDVDDISFLLGRMIDSEQFRNNSLDVNFNNVIYVTDLLSIFENILEMKAIQQIVDKGSCYETDNKIFKEFIDSIEFKLPDNYVELIIRKYYH